jgi:hypothetical protein
MRIWQVEGGMRNAERGGRRDGGTDVEESQI